MFQRKEASPLHWKLLTPSVEMHLARDTLDPPKGEIARLPPLDTPLILESYFMSQAEYHKAYKRQYYKLNKSLSVTVSMDDFAVLKARADELGMKPIPLLRDMAFSVLYDQAFTPELVESELKELRFLIMNIANNINQMAHYSNSVQGMIDNKGLLQELRKLEESISNYTHGRLRKAPHDH